MQISEFYKEYLHVENEELLHDLVRVSNLLTLKKGDFLVRQGETINYVPFLVNGITRGYLIDVTGKDITDCFTHKCGQVCVASSDLEAVAPINIEAITDCVFLTLPISDIKRWLSQYTEINNIYRDLLVLSYKIHWEIKMATYQYSALERYKWFLTEYPELIHKVSLKHIASFLNMTPVTLSRLRHSLSSSEERLNERIESAELFVSK